MFYNSSLVQLSLLTFVQYLYVCPQSYLIRIFLHREVNFTKQEKGFCAPAVRVQSRFGDFSSETKDKYGN